MLWTATRRALLQQQQKQAVRRMGGGGDRKPFGGTPQPYHEMGAEIIGVICWVWVFHRARHDGPVLLGWKHPWEH